MSTAFHTVYPPSSRDGIGIDKFLEGKNYFVTGATGFLGRVLIEKLLRAAPNVGKVFVLIKAKDKEAAMKRLKNEIIDGDLFRCLREIHGKSYYSFMTSKLVPVLGNISEDNMGMDEDTINQLAQEIDVILNSAAFTTFDGRFDVSINTNTKGPVRALNFARKCKKLCLYMQVSTAYVPGKTEALCFEKVLAMGEYAPINSAPLVDVDAEIKLVAELDRSIRDDKEKAKTMRDLGMERAKIHGWRNTYEFSKAMGEMQINRVRGDIPAVIIRPSIVESTYREPFPGWIEGNRMIDPFMLDYGQGQLPCFVGDNKTIMDIVPADMVVNAILAAMAKHGLAAKPELHVYNVTSSVVNPFPVDKFWRYIYDHFASSPMPDSRGSKVLVTQPPTLFTELDGFSVHLRDKILGKNGLQEKLLASDPKLHDQIQRKCKSIMRRATYLATLYVDYASTKMRFESSNTRKLVEDMSKEEKVKYGCDFGIIDWKHYLGSVHIPSIRRNVLEEPVTDPVPTSRI